MQSIDQCSYLLLAYIQFERGEALDTITQDVKMALEEECDEESLQGLSKAVDTVRKQVGSFVLLYSREFPNIPY